MNALTEVAAAAADASVRIGHLIRRTPLKRSSYFSDAVAADVHLKLENRQHTGSFKLRGVLNCLMGLTEAQRSAGCVVASSGNHGAAAAYAMGELGISGVIFVPEQASPAKIDVIRRHGGEIRFFGADGLDTEVHAREYAQRHGLYYLSPYNDEAVIAGQGSCGVEIVEDLPDVDVCYVAVGGGGLISGVGSVLKSRRPDCRIVACQPAASPVMARSVEVGRIVEMPVSTTLSDGTAGGIEMDAITFDICRRVSDEFVLVDEPQIGAAIRRYYEQYGEAIEGAAGVAIAAMLSQADEIEGRRIAIIVCGGNIDADVLGRVL